MGAALVAMGARVTFGKKKYAAVEDQMHVDQKYQGTVNQIRRRLQLLSNV